MPTVDTVIKNSKITTPHGIVEAGVAIDRGKIHSIAKETHLPHASQVINAQGNFVLPGVIDGHVHSEDPGYPRREDFLTVTRAAAGGGVTTIIDHPLTVPIPTNTALLSKKLSAVELKALVDFSLHGPLLPSNLEELESLWDWGVPAVKAFFCSSEPEYPAMYEGDLLVAMKKLAQLNGMCLIHAENDPMLRSNIKRLQKEGRKDWLAHADSRPPIIELIAIQTIISLLEESGATGLLAHTSIPEGILEVVRAKSRGVRVFVESCPHYFYLTIDDLAEKGPWVMIAPCLRDKARVAQLWELLARGHIDVIASDHAPYELQEKEVPYKDRDVWAAPPGIPGIETMLPLMLMGVNRGKIPLELIVRVLSLNPAKIYGFYPKKGSIQPGADADLVLVDMKHEWKIKAENLQSKTGWTPYEDWQVQGAPILTMVRGNIVMDNFEVIGPPGYGKFLPRHGPPPTPHDISS